MEERPLNNAWVGLDVGKEFHWAHVLDASGTQLLSRRVKNDEADLLALIEEVFSLAEEVLWATDQPGGSAALLLALLWEKGQKVIYVPGLTVDRSRDAYRGGPKTDAKDAHIIADQARMRRDLGELVPAEMKPSPNCSSFSLAGATSSPIGVGPLPVLERRFWPSSQLWSATST
jgi:transposase